MTSRAWPLPNLWLGVTAENQKEADRRIPLLLETPAALRFIAAEPLLEKLDLKFGTWLKPPGAGPRLDWVVAGGETGAQGNRLSRRTGPGRCAINATQAATPFFWSQWGQHIPDGAARRACSTALGMRPIRAERAISACTAAISGPKARSSAIDVGAS